MPGHVCRGCGSLSQAWRGQVLPDNFERVKGGCDEMWRALATWSLKDALDFALRLQTRAQKG